jgi:AcrR family transcriptional regulator
MAHGPTGQRGPYAKGIAKREEILERALDVIARGGYRKASVKELADAVGLSQAGLLHYFESKEELFAEILRKRDELALAALREDLAPIEDLRSVLVTVAQHNAEVPGLVELYGRLAVAATDPQHPAHAFFLQRGEAVRSLFVHLLAKQQAAGNLTDRIPLETLARILQAVTDGLQLQWMMERDVDMAATIDALFDLLADHTGPPAQEGSR